MVYMAVRLKNRIWQGLMQIIVAKGRNKKIICLIGQNLKKLTIRCMRLAQKEPPISPVMETPEKLARWLTDNNASAMGNEGASYEHWLRVCKGGWAPTMVISPGKGIKSGVEALS